MTGARLATAAGVVVLAVLYACEKRRERRAEARAAERAARPHSAHTATPGQDAAAIVQHTLDKEQQP